MELNKQSIEKSIDVRPIAELLLAEAHDHHLVTGFMSGREKLLGHKSRVPRGQAWQDEFTKLLDAALIHECARDGYEDPQGARAIFAPTTLGLERLREAALDKELDVLPTRARWVDEPAHLDWPDSLMAWETYQGEILGDVRDADGAIVGEDVVIAEAGLYRLNASLARIRGFELTRLLNEHPDLQSYQSLARDEKGASVALDDLPQVAGLPDVAVPNLIVLDRLKIRASFIGMGLGAQIIRRLFMRYVPEGGLAVITPFPLQFAGRADILDCPGPYEAAVEALRRYYRRLGFVSHRVDPALMVCDMASGPLARLATGAG